MSVVVVVTTISMPSASSLFLVSRSLPVMLLLPRFAWLTPTSEGRKEMRNRSSALSSRWVASAGLGLVTALSACAVVELSGQLTRKTGEAMTDYADRNDGMVAKAAGFGGRVNTAVGTTVEDAARQRPIPSQSTGTVPVSSAGRETQSPQGSMAGAGTAAGREPVMGVMEAQRALTDLGYHPGPADGVMGRRTNEALLKFQKEKGLALSGKLDRETVEALRIAKRQP